MAFTVITTRTSTDTAIPYQDTNTLMANTQYFKDAITIDGGNVGIGITPETWSASYVVQQLGGTSAWSSTTAQASGSVTQFSSNMILDGSSLWTRIVTDECSMILQSNGEIKFFTDTSAAVGSFSPSDRMTIDSAGYVGIAEATPLYPLHVVGECRNTSGTWVAISDGRLKTNISPVNEALTKVLKLSKCINHYEFINENVKGTRTGFIAQKLIDEGFEGHTKEEIPSNEKDGELIGWKYETKDNERVVKKEGDKLLAFENNFDVYLYPAIAELVEIIESQNLRIEALEGK